MGIFPNVSKYIELNNTKRFSGYMIRVKVEEENPAPLRFDISLKRDTIDSIQWESHDSRHQGGRHYPVRRRRRGKWETIISLTSLGC